MMEGERVWEIHKFPIPMRGNEWKHDAAQRVVIDKGEFPIPMRGNEFGSIGRRFEQPERPFPIPMRGNEASTVSRAKRRRTGLPIPMRGNESRVTRVSGSPTGFPIPMRGNEHPGLPLCVNGPTSFRSP